MLRWSSISSRVLLNAFTTRSCTVWQAAHPPVLHVLREGENGERRKNNAREREREGGQERKSERRKKKTTPKNKNQMHKSQWQDLLKPRSKFFFFFPSTHDQGAFSLLPASSHFGNKGTFWRSHKNCNCTQTRAVSLWFKYREASGCLFLQQIGLMEPRIKASNLISTWNSYSTA